MGMTTTMLHEDIARMVSDGRERKAIVELFYQRLYNILEHIKFDINTLRENTLIRMDDMKDLYMISDMYAIQIEEVVDKMITDPCDHTSLTGIGGNKVCSACGVKIA